MYWHNTTWKLATSFTPYEIIYGRPLPAVLQYVPNTARIQSVEDHLYNRDKVKKLLLDNLVKARERMKKFADLRRTERSFEVEDKVLLKLQPYRQSTARGAVSHKLSPKFFGPYIIMEKISVVAYKLQLPPDSKIHNVFHVS